MLQPGTIACFVVALALAAFAIMFLNTLEIVRLWLPDWLNDYGIVLISIIFLARAIGDFHYVGFTKRVRNTTFGMLDTKYYSPLCLFLGINGIVIELLIRRFPMI